MVLPTGTLFQTLDLENFALHVKSIVLSTLTTVVALFVRCYRTRAHILLGCTSVYRNTLTAIHYFALLWIVVQLVHRVV